MGANMKHDLSDGPSNLTATQLNSDIRVGMINPVFGMWEGTLPSGWTLRLSPNDYARCESQKDDRTFLISDESGNLVIYPIYIARHTCVELARPARPLPEGEVAWL
jgi:hypothetical protein